MRTKLQALYRRTAFLRAALLVCALTVALLAAAVVTLDHNARRANAQQASSDLTAAARVSASSFSAVRADLRARASQLAASLPLQHALLTGDEPALLSLAQVRGAAIATPHQHFDALPSRPRVIAATTVTE